RRIIQNSVSWVGCLPPELGSPKPCILQRWRPKVCGLPQPSGRRRRRHAVLLKFYAHTPILRLSPATATRGLPYPTRAGESVSAPMEIQRPHVTSILIGAGVVTEQQVEAGLVRQRETG